MKRFVITSPAFIGEINILYGLDGKLLYVDFMKSDLSAEQITYFKIKMPASFDGKSEELAPHFGTARLNIAEEKYFVSFEQFWNRYDVKRNRIRCEKLWNKLSQANQVAAFFKLSRYERHLQLNTWKTKADPETYLRNEYWNDDWSK